MAILRSDSFSAADGAINGTALDAALGGSAGTWTATGGVSRLSAKVGPTDTAFNLAGVDAGVTDGYVEFVYSTAHGASVYALGRTVDGNNAYRLNVSPTGVVIIELVSGGTPTALWTSGAGAGNVGDRIGLAAFGSNIAAYVNGVLLQTVSDATVTSGTLWGLCFGSAGGTTGRLDNWELSDAALVAAPTGAYLPVRIPNRKVGPMALRHNFQQVLKLSYTAPATDTVIQPLPATLTIGRVADRRTDFSVQADTITPSTTDDTGQTVSHATTILNNPVILGGAWTQNVGPGAVYRWFDEGAPVTRVGVRFRLDNLGGTQTTGSGAVALAMMNTAFNAGDPTVRFGAHFVVTPTDWILQTYRNDTAVFNTLGTASFGTPLVKDNATTYTMELYRWNDTVGLVLPDGTTTRITHPDIAAWSGNFSFIESDLTLSTDDFGRITRYWSDVGVQPDVIPTPGTFAPTVTVTIGTVVTPTGGSLTLTGSASRLDSGIRPAGAALTATGAAPTVTVTANQTVTPTAATLAVTGTAPPLDTGLRPTGASLALTGAQPTVVTPVYPSGASLTLTGAAPRLDFGIRPTGASLMVTGSAPTVITPNTITPAAGTLTLTGAVATVIQGTVATPTAATLTLTGSAPITATPAAVTPAGATLALTGSAPTVVTPVLVTPSAAALSLTGGVPVVGSGVRPAGSSLTLTGQTPAMVFGTVVTPTAAALTATGQPTRIDFGIRPNGGGLTLTGSAPTVTLTANQLVTPGAAALTLTGQAPTVNGALVASPSQATLTVTGAQPTVTATDLKTVTPAAATLSVSGSAPGVVLPKLVTPGAAALALTGSAPVVTAGGNQTATPTAAALTVTGSVPSVITPMVIIPQPAGLTATGFAPRLDTAIRPSGAPLVLTGYAPNLIAPADISPAGAVLSLVGHNPAVLILATGPPPAGRTLVMAADPRMTTIGENNRALTIELNRRALTVAARVP